MSAYEGEPAREPERRIGWVGWLVSSGEGWVAMLYRHRPSPASEPGS